MSNSEIIVGLDLGSSHVRVCVGQLVYADEAKIPSLNIIGVSEMPSEGINRGIITNIDDAVKSISKALDAAERLTGFPIESAWVSLSGISIHSQVSRGIVAVAKTDGEIKEDDMERALEAAKTVTTPPNFEILHVVPRSFSVDGQTGVKDPVGMKGMRLEVDAYIIMGMSSQIKNLTKCIYQTGLDIEDLVLGSLASAEVTLSSKQKELGAAVVNIGSAITTLAVFEQGDLLHVASVPLGSEYITSDVAIGLRTSIEVAEKIKTQFGTASVDSVDKKEELDLSSVDANEDGIVNKKYIAEIIEARLEEIFSKVDVELKKIDRSGSLPGGVVVTGGGAKLNGTIEIAKKTLRLPASLGYPTGVSSVIDKANDLGFVTSLGLVKWGEQSGRVGGSKFRSINAVTDKMKKWFRSLVP
jgi:cell division protein FtsA